MKKWLLLSVIFGAVPFSLIAQDDMYFVPKKGKAVNENTTHVTPAKVVYYSGSDRDVDEYNRRYYDFEVLPDSDIINFSAVEGVYPDSVGDFQLTQQMTKWDDYVPETSYWDGYVDGQRDSWSWHSPWYYSSFYPWYDSWYDPWYYGYSYPWHYGWYDSWYYGWGRGYYSSWYYRPYYYGGWYGGYASVGHRYPGTRNHGHASYSANRGFGSGRSHSYANGTFGSGRNAGSFGGSRMASGSRSTSTSRSTSSRGVRNYNGGSTYSNSHGSFGGSRSSSSSSSSYTPSRSSSSSSSSSSFGGSRSSGSSSFGGSRSSGGGGGRSGGGSFGGGRR